MLLVQGLGRGGVEERTHRRAWGRGEATRVCGRGASGGRGARRSVAGGGGAAGVLRRGLRAREARERCACVWAGGCADAVRGLLTGRYEITKEGWTRA